MSQEALTLDIIYRLSFMNWRISPFWLSGIVI